MWMAFLLFVFFFSNRFYGLSMFEKVETWLEVLSTGSFFVLVPYNGSLLFCFMIEVLTWYL